MNIHNETIVGKIVGEILLTKINGVVYDLIVTRRVRVSDHALDLSTWQYHLLRKRCGKSRKVNLSSPFTNSQDSLYKIIIIKRLYCTKMQNKERERKNSGKLCRGHKPQFFGEDTRP